MSLRFQSYGLHFGSFYIFEFWFSNFNSHPTPIFYLPPPPYLLLHPSLFLSITSNIFLVLRLVRNQSKNGKYNLISVLSVSIFHHTHCVNETNTAIINVYCSLLQLKIFYCIPFDSKLIRKLWIQSHFSLIFILQICLALVSLN